MPSSSVGAHPAAIRPGWFDRPVDVVAAHADEDILGSVAVDVTSVRRLEVVASKALRRVCGDHPGSAGVQEKVLIQGVPGTAPIFLHAPADYITDSVTVEVCDSKPASHCTSIPAVMVARLALDVGLHGEELGGELLWDALTRARAASDIAAARLVVVDAINAQAAAFYEHHGFTPIPENPNRLVQKMSDIASALDTETQ